MLNYGSKPKYEVCPQCEGEGKIVNPAVSVWTRQDIDEDPENFENMRNGMFDVPCDLCHGQRVVTADDMDSFRERREVAKQMAMEDRDWETISNGSYYTP